MNERKAPPRSVRRRAALLLLAAGAAGCTARLPGQAPAPRTYRLTPKTTYPPDLPHAAWALAVAEPTAERALDTSRIAHVRDGTEVSYYADAIWADRAPSMVQNLIVQSFQRSGAIALVGTDRDQLRADFLLRSDLRAFQTHEAAGTPPTVVVRLDAALLSLPRRDLVASESFVGEQPIDGRGMEPVIRAFDEALGAVLKDLVVWTLAEGEAAAGVSTG